MTEIKNWLFGVIAVCAILSAIETITPKGKFRTILRCSGGIILLVTFLQPMLRADWSEISRSFSEWEWVLEGESNTYLSQQKEELSAIIAEKTAAYIEEKAAVLGVVCHAQIDCVEQNGVPFPSEIALDIAYSDQLSCLIKDELGITEVHQHWQEVAG